MNNWTPNKLKIPRVNWTLERAKSYHIGGGCKQTSKPNAKGVSIKWVKSVTKAVFIVKDGKWKLQSLTY